MQDKSLFNEQIQNTKLIIYFKFDKSGHFFLLQYLFDCYSVGLVKATFRASYLYRFCLGWWLSVPAQWPWGPGTVWSRCYTHTYSSHWCLYSDGHRCLLSHIHQYLKSHQHTSMYSHHQQITSICVLHLKNFLSGYSYYWLFIILFCNDIFIII